MCGGMIHPTHKGRVRAVRVEITTVAGESQFTLPDLASFKAPYKILGFSHRSFVAGRKTISGKALVNLPQQKVSHLNLKQGHSDLFLDIPLENVNNDLSGFKDVYWIPPTSMDFSNSQIVVSDITTIVAGEAYELIVYTTDNDC